ncbi:autoinducer binding domain-containing protein [Roseicyclus sp.]|uniref:autoinducer binding domain-containing protein n=1 Tax=Roseicyclus sp. TaxID=1914329 RepID=UPI003F6BB760
MTKDFGSLLPELKSAYPIGFAIALHIRFTSPALLLQAYDPVWIETYSREGMVMHDPTVSWGLRNFGAIRWDDLAQTDAAGAQVLAAARAHGLIHGFTVAVGDPASRSVASFARDDRPATPQEIATAADKVALLHEMTADGATLSEGEHNALAALSILLTKDSAARP